MKFAVTGVALLAVTLSGCGSFNPMKWWGSGPEEQAPQRLAGATRYQCAEGRQLAVRYGAQGQTFVMVILPEREFRLDQAPPGSGAGTRYTNGRTTLVSRGDEAELEEGGKVLYSGCKRAA